MSGAEPEGTGLESAGALREQVWTALMRARACSYPLPPHGHHPNFKGARRAAQQLLAHPRLAGARCLIVGPERALYPLRTLALASGVRLYVPDQRRAGWYRLLDDPAGARLSAMPALSEPKLTPAGAQAAVLASVAVTERGERLSKGFGWSAHGLRLGLPEFTLAHPLMLQGALPGPPDSRVQLIATPERVIEVPAGVDSTA